MHDDNLTLATIKAIIDERDHRYQQMAEATEKAINIAENNSQRWRESANEWRDAMNDREAHFVKSELFRATTEHLSDDLKALKERMDQSQGEGAGAQKLWIILVAAISTVGVLALMLTHWNK